MTAYDDNPHATGDYVTFKADSTKDRRSRAAEIGAVKRAYEKLHEVTLELVNKSYDEAYGFLRQSAFRYRIVRPAPPAPEPAPVTTAAQPTVTVKLRTTRRYEHASKPKLNARQRRLRRNAGSRYVTA